MGKAIIGTAVGIGLVGLVTGYVIGQSTSVNKQILESTFTREFNDRTITATQKGVERILRIGSKRSGAYLEAIDRDATDGLDYFDQIKVEGFVEKITQVDLKNIWNKTVKEALQYRVIQNAAKADSTDYETKP